MDPTREPPSIESSYKAAHAVLNNHELLHDILVRLPVKDFVVATGVCQTWRKLKDSVAIQKAMFPSPVEISDIMADTDLRLSMRLEDIPRDEYSIVRETHSHLVAFSSEEDRFDWRLVFQETLLEIFESNSLSKHPLGCWRDMFTSQPPTTTVSIVLYQFFRPRSHRKTERGVFKCDTGVKMGELYDFCLSVLRSDQWASGCRAELKGFMDLKGRPGVDGGGRWDVRDGKIHRQTQLSRDIPKEESPSDEEDSWDKETWDRHEYVLAGTLRSLGRMITATIMMLTDTRYRRKTKEGRRVEWFEGDIVRFT